MINKIKILRRNRKKPPQPIFIGGEGRSGTTLMRAMINNHPKIFCGPETHFFIDKNFIDYHDVMVNHYSNRISEYNENVRDEVNQMYRGMINNFFTKHMNANKKRRWADKTPYNVKVIDFLLEVFEGNIKFIHMIRDGRDVASSITTMPWGPKTVKEAAHNWTTIIANTRKHVGKDYYIEIKYEDLVREETKILKEVCEFLGEDFNQQMLDYYKDEGLGGSDESSYNQIIQPLYTKSIGRWKKDLSTKEQKDFMEVAGETMRTLGYTNS
jgi:hypothetical protein